MRLLLRVASLSSLLHVPIMTPVIFTWLRERELSRKETAPAA